MDCAGAMDRSTQQRIHLQQCIAETQCGVTKRRNIRAPAVVPGGVVLSASFFGLAQPS
jgi:hypothetical protein